MVQRSTSPADRRPPVSSRQPAAALPEWLAAMLPSDVRRYRIAADDQTVSVMEFGPEAGQPVLLVHGNPTWGFLYRLVARHLGGSGLRLIVPDLVGLGYSSRVDPAEHTLENHARWFGGLLDSLGLLVDADGPGDSRPVVVVQDWGGPIATLALSRRPAPPAGLVILNTVLAPPRPGFRPTAFHQLAQTPVVSDLLFRGLGFPTRGLFLAQGDRSTLRGRVARAYQEPLERFSATPLALARMVPDGPNHPSVAPLGAVRDWVATYDGPCELIWGCQDPVLGSVIGYMQTLLPHARVTRTQAGHFLQEEVPDLIADAIRRVLPSD